MGVDYGRRRIGVAITDETGSLVRGICTIDCKQSIEPIEVLKTIVNQEQPQKIVFGEPLSWDNSETSMSKEVRCFAQKVSESIPLPIDFIDESHSSIRASEILSTQKKKNRKNKINTDRIAACIILENYLREHGQSNLTD